MRCKPRKNPLTTRVIERSDHHVTKASVDHTGAVLVRREDFAQDVLALSHEGIAALYDLSQRMLGNHEPPGLSNAEYKRQDYRLRCRSCGRWMRYTPTEKSPAQRRPAPNANRCIDCPKNYGRA